MSEFVGVVHPGLLPKGAELSVLKRLLLMFDKFYYTYDASDPRIKILSDEVEWLMDQGIMLDSTPIIEDLMQSENKADFVNEDYVRFIQWAARGMVKNLPSVLERKLAELRGQPNDTEQTDEDRLWYEIDEEGLLNLD